MSVLETKINQDGLRGGRNIMCRVLKIYRQLLLFTVISNHKIDYSIDPSAV